MSKENLSVSICPPGIGAPTAEFTGERYLPHISGEIAWEHLHRYACALEISEGLDVLDIACGEGYGSYMLSQVAKSVVGVDIDGATVRVAGTRYVAGNLRFEQGDCCTIPAPDKVFDLVVSFETIEHIKDQPGFLDEVLRVLRPNGVLLISSPERESYQIARGASENEFHEKELSLDELESLLKGRFKHVQLSRQLPLFGSFIAGCEGSSVHASVRVATLDGDSVECADRLTRGPYILGLCSQVELTRSLSTSLFDPQLPPNHLSALEAGIVARDEQRRADSARIAELLQGKRTEEEHRRVRSEALNRVTRSWACLVAATSQNDMRPQSASNSADKEGSSGRPNLGQMLKGLKMDLVAVPSLRKCPEFDVGHYYPALQHIKWGRIFSILHYQLIGWRRGLNPNSKFDTVWYREFNTDVGAAWCSPLAHYVKHGKYEGRAVSQVDEDRRSSEELAHRVSELNARLAAIPGMLTDLKAVSADVIKLRDEMSQDADAGSTIRTGEVLQKVADINVDIREADQLRAPYDDAPEVSVIIPVFNQLRSTLSCIHSLVRHRTKYSFEIIVVDDCSTDLTVTACGAIPELRIVNKEKNSGFIDSCNRGAQVARGKKVVFLNNDTYVLPQWLDNLVDTFETVPCTGLVGSQLLYPDGSLQEAGGIIWRDGQAWNYGRNQDAARGEFNYLRDVDFCSGASLMIDRELFLDLGGFDSHYAPAYCEDVDLAFKVRERGLRVLYQPFSRLIHFEGVSSGTDVRVGVKSYQVANLEKIKTRWAAQLTRHAPSDVPPEIARDYQVKGRIFFVDALTPTPDQDAGSIVADTWLTALIELGYHVTFFADSNRGYISHYTDRLQRIGVYALIPPTSHELESFISQFGASYDLVIGLRYGSTEPVFRAFEACGLSPKKFFLPIDLHYVREMRQAELNGSADKRQSALETKRDELSVAKESDIILVHSSYEQDELAREIPGADVRVSPIITDVKGCKSSFEDRKDICFIGGFQHLPNVDAVNFFVKEVLPLVTRVLPDVVFKVIGSKPPVELDALRSKNVEILGFVQDLGPLWSTIRLSVAPLRFGAGVKGKVCMSLSYGVPVVCTPIAAEGMGLQDGREVLIGATAQELADQIVRAYTDPAVWRGLSIAGMKLVDEEFSTATNRKRIVEYLEDAGIGITAHMDSTAA